MQSGAIGTLHEVIRCNPVALGLALLGVVALLPDAIKPVYRFGTSAALIAAAFDVEVETKHPLYLLLLAVAVGTWMPVGWWTRQVRSDQAHRKALGLPELYGASSTIRAESPFMEPGTFLYRWRMNYDSDSWDLLFPQGIPRGPLFLKQPPPEAHPYLKTPDGPASETLQAVGILRHHGYEGAVTMLQPEGSDDLVFLVDGVEQIRDLSSVDHDLTEAYVCHCEVRERSLEPRTGVLTKLS